MKLISYQLLAALYLAENYGLSSLDKEKLGHFWTIGYKQAFSRLMSSHLIDYKKPIINRKFVGLTYLGKNKLLQRFPLLNYWFNRSDGVWDGQMTLVAFNIPERERKRRDSLRYRLKTLGFGQINRSLYLSPHLTVREAKSLGEQVFPLSLPLGLTTWSTPSASLKDLEISSFWDLNRCEEAYERALAVWEAKQDAAGFVQRFFSGLFDDPHLPSSLLSESWVGNKAHMVARSILISAAS